MSSIPRCGFATPSHLSGALQGASSPDYTKTFNEGRAFRKQGLLREATRSFQRAAEIAEQTNSYSQAAEALVAKSGCEIRLFQYAVALHTTNQAKEFALKAKDHTFAGAADSNLAVVYTQLGDFSSARTPIFEAVKFLADSPRKDYYSSALAVQGGAEFGLHMSAEGTASYKQAIAVAKGAKLPQLEARESDDLGSWLIFDGDYAGAEAALTYAQKIFEALGDNEHLAGSYEHLAELELRRGGPSLKSAQEHINLAFSTKSQAFVSSPQYFPLHTRGQILLSLGQRDKALADFHRAVDAADTWRQSVLPGDTTDTKTVAQLDSVYKDYAHLAAEISLEHADHALARDAFEVLARNRAASLREQLARSNADKLLKSPEYFDLLQRLQAVQASATLESDKGRTEAHRVELNQIRAQLGDLENRIGLLGQNSRAATERKGSRNSLRDIQARLGPSEALFDFSLGEPKSFLWAVTREDLRLYDLPKEKTIAQQAEAFSHAVSTGSPEKLSTGRALSRSLLINVAPSLQKKSSWLLTLDGALLDKVPFSYLPAIFESPERALCYGHTLRILPSPSLLRVMGVTKPSGLFVGVGDPIYNLADSRLDHSKVRRTRDRSKQSTSAAVLSRIPASEPEVKASAEKCGMPQIDLLLGKDASIPKLRGAAIHAPQILHFAVHVISPKDFPQEAAIALSTNDDNLPELLTAESVATFSVPGSLVVLSGCASQQGAVVPGAGLVGLSRSWLLAGAAAVMVSAWPTPDNSSSFFPTFYTHYRQATGSVAQRAAVALQQTQIDMQRVAGHQSDPRFWAAYSIISRE